MARKQWFAARVLVVSGFFVTFAGASVISAWILSRMTYGHIPMEFWIEEVAIPLGSLSTLIAWWFLTKITVPLASQGDLFRKAFLALSLESLLVCAANAAPLFQYFHLDWVAFGDLLYAIGSFTTACGFFLIARRYSSNPSDNQDAVAFDDALAEERENIPFEEVRHELGWP
jgi:hypothetical protein